MTLEAQIYSISHTSHKYYEGAIVGGQVSALTTDNVTNVIPVAEDLTCFIRLETDLKERDIRGTPTLTQTAFLVKADRDLEEITEKTDAKLLFKSPEISGYLHPLESSYKHLIPSRGIEFLFERVRP